MDCPAATLNTIKINTGSNLVIESYFRDAPSQIANTGSLPLELIMLLILRFIEVLNSLIL